MTPARGFRALEPLLRPRAALGLQPAVAPATLILPAGFLLGPHALGLISSESLGYFDTVITIALAMLGVYGGIAFGPHLRSAKRLIAAASIEALVTIGIVTAAIAFLLDRANLPVGVSAMVIALCLGICAAASAASSSDSAWDPAARTASQVADLDDVLPIVAGGAALMLAGGRGAWDVTPLLAAPAIGLAIGTAGWLLFERAESNAERGALLLGSLALLGGAPAYLSASPLVAGFTAGLVWRLTPGRADRIVDEDLQKLQHPLIVLLLVAAGATCVPSVAAAWLAAPYVLFRLTGKLAGAWIAARVTGLRISTTPIDLGMHLIPPGVMGVAFALAFMQVLPTDIGALIVTTVALGSIVSELVAFYVIPAEPAG